MSGAGSTVQLSTFNRWNVTEAGIGHKKIVKDGVVMVNYVWCKLCATHIASIRKDHRVRGIAKQEVGKYVEGTYIVTKHNVTRHLRGSAHKVAVEYEKRLGPGQGEPDTITCSETAGTSGTQSKIDGVVHKLAKDTYRKLLRTAYLMAVDGQRLASFKTLVKCQKANGVKLIEGAENGNAARELTHEIANAVREKVAILLCSCTAFSILSDGSQERRTGSEKELVMIRTVKGGIPTYYVLGLRDIDQFGEVDAENFKKSIDGLFERYKLPNEHYINFMVSATADGASVNRGMYNGLLSRMKNEGRTWLVTVHCVGHRLELAVKDSILEHTEFSDAKDFLLTLYYLMKRCGRFKRQFEKIATRSYDVQTYRFPTKVYGTRFVEHQRNGLTVLLSNWVPLGLAIEDMITKKKNKKLVPKLKGILEKLRDYQFLSNCCLYKCILDGVSDLIVELDSGDLMVFDVTPACEVTSGDLLELSKANECPLQKCGFSLDETSHVMSVKLPKACHMKEKPRNNDFVDMPLKMNFVDLQFEMTHTEEGQDNARINDLKSKVIPSIQKCLTERLSCFKNELFSHMMWVDPANWKQKIEDEMVSLEYLSKHFQNTLDASGFKSEGLTREWRNFKVIVNNYYAGISALELWPKIFQYRRAQFPNVCKLVEIVLAIGPSNSVVGNAFSQLTTMLSDKWLSVHHSTMEDLMLIKANNNSWTDQEREEIIEAALTNYITKKRKRGAKQGNDSGAIDNGSKCKKIKLEVIEEHTHGDASGLLDDSDHSSIGSESEWSSLASDDEMSFGELSENELLAEETQFNSENIIFALAEQDT